MATENYLYLATSVALNKSFTKQVCVGVKADSYKSVVQLFNLNRYKVIEFDTYTWSIFCDQINNILSLFNAPIEQSRTLNFAGISVTLFGNDKFKYIVMENQSCKLQMRESTLETLQEKANWINRRLEDLESIPFEEYNKTIVHGIAEYLEKNTKWNKNNIPHSLELYPSLINKYKDIYIKCEMNVKHDFAVDKQLYSMYFSELVYFNYDYLYEKFYKHLFTFECKPKAFFYGEDTVF